MNGENRFCFDIRVPFLTGDKVKMKEEIKNIDMHEGLKLNDDMKFEGTQKVEKNAGILGVFLENGYLYKYSMLERVE